MGVLQNLFENNRRWAGRIKRDNPDFFQTLSNQQNPDYLWIGCSDSRIPANEIVGLMPGELFVHRNVANIVHHSDINCLSVLQYAVEVLKVEHVIVCGHYNCGGVNAAMTNAQYGLIDHWLRPIKSVYVKYRDELESLENLRERQDRLCELNVIEQVANVCHTSIVQNAWERNQPLSIHGWLYHVEDGLIVDHNVTISSLDQIDSVFHLTQKKLL